MDLIDLIEQLVADPAELAAFKAEGEAYLMRRYPDLGPQLRALMLRNHYLETGTVMSIKSRDLVADAADAGTEYTADSGPPSVISLAGSLATLRTDTPFFAEHLANPPDPWPGYVCTLLPHSFAHAVQYGSHWVVHVMLNLSFVDPRNKRDQPQLLSIISGDPNYEPLNYNLGNTTVYMHITPKQYILLRGAHDFSLYLAEPSAYYPRTHMIHLHFDDPQAPPL